MNGVIATLRVNGEERALGSVTFSDSDASVYLRPCGDRGSAYDYGYCPLAAGETAKTFETVGQLRATERPHISIHDSGSSHVRAGSGRALLVAAEDIGPLRQFRAGAHVGSVLTSDIGILPTLAEVWPDSGARDERAEPWDVTPPADAVALRAVVFVSRNPHRRQLSSYTMREFERRRSDGGKLFVSIEMVHGPVSLGEPMIGAIGGWNPLTSLAGAAARFVYVRDSRDVAS